jgi:hypothetical protein
MDTVYKDITPRHILPCEPLPGEILQANELIIDKLCEPLDTFTHNQKQMNASKPLQKML